MGKIVAIGGGELRLKETLEIDKYIVNFSGVINPRLLFIPTASGDSAGYIKTIERIYGEQLGCKVDTLLLIDKNITEDEIQQKILSSDIIYVGGGDTVKMLEVWRINNVDIYLKMAYEKDIILSGLSAGSICWFDKGHGDSDGVNNTDGWWDYTQPLGIGLIPAIHCPHYNNKGYEFFDEVMKNETLPGIAIEDNCALVIRDDLYKIIKSDLSSKAYILTNHNGKISKKELNTQEYLSVSSLLYI